MNEEILKSDLTWDEIFMRHVYLAASKSKDPRTKIGSILVRDNIIISEGFNGFPRGVKDLKERYFNRETKLNYICHAEFNSVINCARNGVNTYGSTCYTQGLPCMNCCKTLIQAGIKNIVTHWQWPFMEKWANEQNISKQMLNEAKIPYYFYNKILNLKGLNDGKIIKV